MTSSHHEPLFNAKVTLPNLEYLRLSSVQVENIWDDQPGDFITGTQKLTTLVIEDCGNLCYSLSPSMVTSLVQRQELDVETVTSPFPNLQSLKLNRLPKLASLCIGNLIELSSLKDLQIQGCSVMRKFISSDLDSGSDGTDLAFFDRKVSLPKLEKLQIRDMEQLKMIWHSTQFHPNSFCKLKILWVNDAKRLLYIFPSNSFFTQFCHLKELSISRCDSLERVFGKQMVIYPQESNSKAASQLQSVRIAEVSNLKYIWNWDETDDLQGVVSFHNLRKVIVIRCPSIEAIFPAPVAKDLPFLQQLNLIRCERLKEIVVEEEEEGVNKEVPLFKLHQLSGLQLVSLPNLSVFHSGMHISEWPALKKLALYDLPEKNIFDDRLESVSQPFFPLAKILPKLEQLAISSFKLRKLPADLFHEIKYLVLSFLDDESTVFPYDFLHKFPHLETLGVVHGNFTDLFFREEEDGNTYRLGRSVFQQLRHLSLTKVEGLNHIWHPDSQLDHLQNIVSLEISFCYSLIELSPSAASFQNLVVLKLYECQGLQHVLSSTTAKSLEQLQYMSVNECDNVTKIVKNEGDGLDDSIIFTKLARLQLVGLPEFTCFCSTKHSLKFPSLVELIVKQCPTMMSFSGGYLSTPELWKVILAKNDESSCRWNGNLNRTVEMLFQEKNAIEDGM